MTDALIVGDVHVADKAPSSRRDTYTAEILKKIEYAVDFSNGLGLNIHADVTKPENRGHCPLIFAGDIFHIKTPWRSSYGLVQRVHDILKRAEGGVWIVPGNHDLRDDRLDSLSSQPLGALARMGNVRLLIGTDPDLPGIHGVPYLSAFDGGDWGTAIQDWYATIDPDGKEPDWAFEDLIVTHAPIFPMGAEPGVYAHIAATEWAQWWTHTGPANTYYGHIHEAHGVYMEEGMQFANLGALSRGSLHESSIKRAPTITRWEDGQFIPHVLPASVVKPAAEVFLFAEAAAKGEAKSSAAEFTEALGSVVLANLTVEEVIDQIKARKPEPAVLKIVESVMEEASR